MDDARETTKEARGVLFKAYDTSQSLVMQVLAFSLFLIIKLGALIIIICGVVIAQ